MSDTPSLSSDQIKAMVNAKLDEYKGLSMLEQYAMFMGKAQILEFGLKGLLLRKFNVSLEESEVWTLGKSKSELKNRGLRGDFISLLESVVAYRNSMAHEFLVNHVITKTVMGLSDRKASGELFRAVFELEQLMILYDWCEENDGW